MTRFECGIGYGARGILTGWNTEGVRRFVVIRLTGKIRTYPDGAGCLPLDGCPAQSVQQGVEPARHRTSCRSPGR